MTSTEIRSAVTDEDVKAVSPALAAYTQRTIVEDLWKRPGLSARDRGMVTAAALIARNQTVAMVHYFTRALECDVAPEELSETVLHLAFYCGWPNAMAAVAALKEVFTAWGVRPSQLPEVFPSLLELDQEAEAKRATTVQQNLGEVAPGVVKYTTDLLFNDLWLRPALAPRDRSLITVSALVATGQVAQITFHLNRAMDNGLTKEQASEVFTHLAFYTGWPSVMSALPVAKDVFKSRER